MNDNFAEIYPLDEFAEVCEWLAFKGWSEAEGGNLSLRLEQDQVPDPLKESDTEPVKLPLNVKELAGKYLLITGSGTRSRDIAT